MFDQLTAPALGCYGNNTSIAPNIDRLANEGVVFDSAYSNSPLCTPARCCLMTGRLPSLTGGYDNASYLPTTVPTIAHYLRDTGYRTILSGKMDFVGPDQMHGFEERRTTDMHPADFGWTPDWEHHDERIDWWYHNMSSVTGAGTAEVTNQLLYDDEVGHHALRALHDAARSDDGRPFFIVASFAHPHDPYVARKRFWDLYEGVEIDMPRVPVDLNPHPHTTRLLRVSDIENSTITNDDIRRARRAYYANISYVDEWTGRIMESLSDLGLSDDTLTLLVADHGDMLGEHGLWYKMNFFEGAARIPLIAHFPNALGPHRVSDPVSLIDVLPTFAEIAETNALFEPMSGKSLVPLLENGSAVNTEGEGRTVYGEYLAEGAIAPIVMIRRNEWKFIHSPADPDQLFNLSTDPDELHNLAMSPDHLPTVEKFLGEIRQRWDLAVLGASVIESQRTRRFLTQALRSGEYTSWDYTPVRDGSQEYMRNHLDLNEVERLARWPR